MGSVQELEPECKPNKTGHYFGAMPTPEVSRGPLFAQDQIARAVERGLGVTTPTQIALVTADAASEAYAQQLRGLLLA